MIASTSSWRWYFCYVKAKVSLAISLTKDKKTEVISLHNPIFIYQLWLNWLNWHILHTYWILLGDIRYFQNIKILMEMIIWCFCVRQFSLSTGEFITHRTSLAHGVKIAENEIFSQPSQFVGHKTLQTKQTQQCLLKLSWLLWCKIIWPKISWSSAMIIPPILNVLSTNPFRRHHEGGTLQKDSN